MAVLRRYTDLLFRVFSIGQPVRMLIYGMVIGVISAFAAMAFFYILEVVQHFLFGVLCDYHVKQPAGEGLFEPIGGEVPVRWLFFLLPVIGGLVGGFIVYRWAPEAEGVGTEAMIRTFHQKRGIIRFRVPYLKAAASIITLGTGGSVGREGPISQIGAGLGSWIATRLHLGVRQRRILLLAGASGGLGAIFRSPLGAAISSVEILYSEDMESEALLPSVISSVTAYTIFSTVFGYDRIFQIPPVGYTRLVELPFYLVLGLLCIPMGIFYIKMFHGVRTRLFGRMKVSRYLKPAIGGLMVGLLGLFVPQVYGTSWGMLQEALFGNVALTTMLIIAVLKMFATAFTLGSGGSGGVFGPTLFIGGMIGGAVGQVGHMLAPEIVTQPHAYIMVGMAAFFAGVANAPLGVLLMVCEIKGGYNLIAPLLLVSVVAILFSRGYSIFPSQVTDKFHSPAHLGDVTFNVLEDIQVDRCYHAVEQMPIFPHNMKLAQLPEWVRDPDVHMILVSNQRGKVIGFLPGDALRTIPEQGAMANLVILFDIMERYHPVRSDSDLFHALRQLRRFQQKALPVVDAEHRPVGCILVDDIMDAYANEVFRKAEEGRDDDGEEAEEA
jgi:CIC family chloride channel protein